MLLGPSTTLFSNLQELNALNVKRITFLDMPNQLFQSNSSLSLELTLTQIPNPLGHTYHPVATPRKEYREIKWFLIIFLQITKL